MVHEVHDYDNLNVTRDTEVEEDEGNVDDSTTLLDPLEGEAPLTTNNDIASSMATRRNFDHHSEDDSYVPSMSS
jgi:hypothetical protein